MSNEIGLSIAIICILTISAIVLIRRQTSGGDTFARHRSFTSRYFGAALFFTVLAVYGSLVPCSYKSIPFATALEWFGRTPLLSLDVYRRADWVANILLYFPLGFLWTAALTAGEASRVRRGLGAFQVSVSCCALGVFVEFLQVWFPPRTVSLNDIIAESIGGLVGATVWFFAGERLIDAVLPPTASKTRADSIKYVLFLYAAGLAVYSLLPLDIVLNWGELQQKAEQGRLAWFFRGSEGVVLLSFASLAHALMLTPVGALFALRNLGRGRSAWAALVPTVLTATGIEVAQAFVFSRYASGADAMLGSLGGVLGVVLVSAVWFRASGGQLDRALTAIASRRTLIGGTTAVAYTALLFWLYARPGSGPPVTDDWATQWRTFWRPPFAALYWGSEFSALTNVLQKAGTMTPLGALLTWVFTSLTAGFRRTLPVAVVVAIGFGIEFMQCSVPTRLADLTDVLIYAMGGWVGAVLASIVLHPANTFDSCEHQAEEIATGEGRSSEEQPPAYAAGKLAWATAAIGVVTALYYGAYSLSLGDTGNQNVENVAPTLHDSPPEKLVSPQQAPSIPQVNSQVARAPMPSTYADFAGAVFAPAPTDVYRSPIAEEIPLPDFPGAYAVWGAVGRDTRGHIWVGASVMLGYGESARLFEYLPEEQKLIPRGDVLSELRRLGLYKQGETQNKIHSRFVQAADGYLYFTSMDEQGEREDGSVLPKWGSHMWRLRLDDYTWEHVFAAPEGLIAVSGHGQWVYALGYFDHVLYQLDTKTGAVKKTRVGSVGGHVSRNFVCDHRGHAFVPRLSASANQGKSVELIEFNTQLGEIGQTPLPHYRTNSQWDDHGIVSFQPLVDRSIVLATAAGYLHRIIPSTDGPAAVEELGWIHPDGQSYVASLFTFGGKRFLLGVSDRKKQREWLVYDLQRKSALPVNIPSDSPLRNPKNVYGSVARADNGDFYCVGWKNGEQRPLSSDLLRTTAKLGISGAEVAEGLKLHSKRLVPCFYRIKNQSILYRLSERRRLQLRDPAIREAFLSSVDVDSLVNRFVIKDLALWREAAVMENGCFHCNLDREWKQVGTPCATLISQARLLVTFSSAYEITGDPEYLQTIRSGADFLLNNFTDPEYGGFFWRVNGDGTVADSKKDAYGHAHVTFGLSHAYRVTGDKRYLDAAFEAWRIVKQRFRDDRGGICWHVSPDFQKKGGRSLDPYTHLFEAVLSLYEVSRSEEVYNDAIKMAEFVFEELYNEEGAYIPEWFNAEWKQDGKSIWTGHLVEWSYLLSWAVELGFPEEYLVIGNRMLDFSLENGYDSKNGGLVSGGGGKGKIFWVQYELLRTLLRYATLHGRSDLWPKYRQSAAFHQKHFIDDEFGGTYSAYDNSISDSEQNRVKSGPWKRDYHLWNYYTEAIRLRDNIRTQGVYPVVKAGGASLD